MLALRTGRYARRLAAIWCVYFLTAAVLTLAAHAGVFSFGLGVAATARTLSARALQQPAARRRKPRTDPATARAQ